ncbi:thermonuclease family protein [Microbacterium aurantiacum]|uniref:thermonuclease family protein n=1 Tax=Microbacterium aurantiacum TaxID=162393 RepID=UPI001F157D09|nr:thermonuclease family protein [Microbacterium aurantiacum]
MSPLGRRRVRRWVLLASFLAGALVIVVLLVLFATVGAERSSGQVAGVPSPPADAERVEIVSITDGDTVRARGVDDDGVLPRDRDVPVRLIGVDTPEVRPSVECGGAEATRALEDLLPVGSRAWVSVDAEPRDRYDRVLLYLWTEDGTFVNHALVASGAGVALEVEPNSRYADLFAAAEASARSADAGVWGSCR